MGCISSRDRGSNISYLGLYLEPILNFCAGTKLFSQYEKKNI